MIRNVKKKLLVIQKMIDEISSVTGDFLMLNKVTDLGKKTYDQLWHTSWRNIIDWKFNWSLVLSICPF